MTFPHAPHCTGGRVKRVVLPQGDRALRCSGCGWFQTLDAAPEPEQAPPPQQARPTVYRWDETRGDFVPTTNQGGTQ